MTFEENLLDVDGAVNSLKRVPSNSGELMDSYEMAKRLLPFMAKRGIPATPQNYSLFYDYLTYANTDLNIAVHGLLDQDQFNQEKAHEIYKSFCVGEFNKSQAQILNKATCEFIALSCIMEKNLESVQTKATHYQAVLTNSSRKMSSQDNLVSIKPILTELLVETETALVGHVQFSTQIQVANLAIANLQEELKTQMVLATVDELTKLHNRRFFNQEAPSLIEVSKTMDVPLTAIMLDLDKFKVINDTWGHNFGDKILKLCADLFKKNARNTDMVIRLGGEEFLMLCPGLSLANATIVAERVRVDLATTDITIRGQSLQVTLSGGVAEYIQGEDLDSFIGRADKALYQAKSDGRNCIRLAK